MSLRLALVLGFVAMVAGGVLVVTRIVNEEVPRQTYSANEESLADTAALLAAFVEARLEDGDIPVADLRQALESARSRDLGARIHEIEKRSVGVRVYVTDGTGRVVFDSNGGKDEGRDYSRWHDVRRTLRGEYGARASRGVADDPTSSIHYVAAPIRSGDSIVGVLSVGKPVRELGGLIEVMQDRIARAASWGLGLAAIAGVGLAYWISRPIGRLVAFSQAVAEGQRVALPRLYGREVRELGRALEGMREALSGRRQAESAIRGLVHEVKAPLAGIRASAELLQEDLPNAERQRFLGHILAESDRLLTLVGRMLDLAALEGQAVLEERQLFDLSTLAREAVEAETPLALHKGVELSATAQGNSPVRGDALLLRQAIRNLVHNAVRASPSGGTVSVTTTRTGEWSTLTVDDSGPGIPEFALPRLFERFYSLPLPGETRRGTGLGLPFVREVALLHGGEITLGNREGGGARATLRLPV